MESSNVVSLLEDDDFMPVQSTNPITQMVGDDGHLPIGAGLLSLGSTCDIHTAKKKMSASTVDSVLVLLPGILELSNRRASRSSSYSTIGRLEGFHQQGSTPSVNNLTLSLGGYSDTNSSENSNGKTEDDILATESPKIVLRGRAIPSKTTFVLLQVTASAKNKTNKKQPPPKVVCKGVYRNVLVFGEGAVAASPLQNGVDESHSITRRWRHYGASERCDCEHCDDEEESRAPSIQVQRSKEHDDVMLRSSSSSLTPKGSIPMDISDSTTRGDVEEPSIDQPNNGDAESDGSCFIVNEESKESPRRLSARKNKQRVSYKDIDENEDTENIEDFGDANWGVAKNVKLEQAQISSASKRERKRRGIESPVSPLGDDVVIVDMEADSIEQLEVVGILDSNSKSKIVGKPRKEDSSLSTSDVITLSVAQIDNGVDVHSKRTPVFSTRLPSPTDASSSPSKASRSQTILPNTSNLKQKTHLKVILLDSKSAASSTRPPTKSAPSTPSSLPDGIASTPSSIFKKRRRRPIASTPPRSQANVFMLDEDDEFAFLGE
jgi:hypothetical protein